MSQRGHLVAFLVCLVSVQNVAAKVFPWTIKKVTYPSKNKYLAVPPMETKTNRHVVTQCAMDCLRDDRCLGYNFLSGDGICELHDVTSTDVLTELMETNQTSQYYLKETFSIDQEALGRCAGVVCQNGGMCLETTASLLSQTYQCVCPEGWNGEHCETQAVPPAWSTWGVWGQCSVTCGSGWRLRSRLCQDPDTGFAMDPFVCRGRDTDIEACDLQQCPRWENWGPWGPCSTERMCGKGQRSRTRGCSNQGTVGVDRYCMGPTNETGICYSIDCKSPVRLQDGSLFGEGRVEMLNDLTGEWGLICADHWDANAANTACRQMGFREASEVVTDGRYGGNDLLVRVANFTCPTVGRILQKCPHSLWSNTTCLQGKTAAVKCKVDGDWNMWTNWGECSVSCGDGTQTRTRECSLPPTLHGGIPCTGANSESRDCVFPPCPGSGTWGTWGPWEACGVSCGDGYQRRYRSCVDTEVSCSGDSEETQSCNTNIPCPVDGQWHEWSLWSECDVSCNGGHRQRHRNCSLPKYGGQACFGDSISLEACNSHPCSEDGIWLEWTNWSSCSVSCGNGSQQRSRDCNPAKHGGENCTGTASEHRQCNTHHCPIYGFWLSWSEWSFCSLSCGGGIQERIRVCNSPQHGGASCSGPGTESRLCHAQPCPVDGFWMSWTVWSSCALSCGNGTQYRSRDCFPGQYGGSNCSGSASGDRECNTQPCPVDGYWLSWATWSDCSRVCGNGSYERSRVCSPPQHDGRNCTGSELEIGECNTHPCPVDAYWLSWTKWSKCSLSCGSGTRQRTRDCQPAKHGGMTCVGDNSESRACNTHYCPVDGVLGSWSEWDVCSMTCGGGVQERHRKCDGPDHGGQDCDGQFTDQQSCNINPCPKCTLLVHASPRPILKQTRTFLEIEKNTSTNVMTYSLHSAKRGNSFYVNNKMTSQRLDVDGVFQDWSDWGECSVSCGGGAKSRTRLCTPPLHGGEDCLGDKDETEDCNTNPCPIDGEWMDWSDWDMCTVTCGGGTRKRERVCGGRAHGGRDCEGTDWEVETCSTDPCPVDGMFDEWAEWGECSEQCGRGIRVRHRDCTPPMYGGKDCVGASEEEEVCNTHECPIDGQWMTWSIWGKCTVSCGGGTRNRERECTGQAHGGRDCDGTDWEVENCNTVPCPVDGEFTTWSDWGQCSVTCGGGTQTRNRDCILPQHGGEPCDGDRYQIQDCGTDDCPIDGRWNIWGDWGPCSVTCGPGSQQRERSCVGPYYGGKPCSGSETDEMECDESPCLIPGNWDPWSDWSSCSITCGGGIRIRTRQCDMTSHGNLTAPCDGDEDDSEECNTFPCQPYARTCSGLVALGLIESAEVDIDPDGPGGEMPIKVFCDLQEEDGVGVTIIGHDHEGIEEVNGYEGAGEYDTGNFVYNATWEQVLALIDYSAHCKQFISWKCKAALIHNFKSFLISEEEGGYILTTYWRNRTGRAAHYWGGATPGSGSCDCGLTRSCANPDMLCNCDANDPVWREDSGYINVKDDLPVTSFAAGDTGNSDEEGSVLIGLLHCYQELD